MEMDMSNKPSCSSKSDNNSSSESDTEFKKPQVNKFIKKKSAAELQTSPSLMQTRVDTVSTGNDNSDLEEQPKEVNQEIRNQVLNNLKYVEPSWSGLPTQKYMLEVIKSGMILKTIDLSQRPFLLLGRSEDCDIVMSHSTISRYHLILQYRNTSDDGQDKGFYLYDFGSTHGTFLNKQQIESKTYVNVKVGHMIKFGKSSRFYVLHGPSDDEEPETEMSWTELKKKHLESTLEKDQMNAKGDHVETMEEDKEEESGIDWGMGEDASEDMDLSENPFAATQNEELYIDDPKKTLSGWFDREGEELEYKIEQKGFGHFVCQVELPVHIGKDGKLVAEASVKGKKKEAVIQCALEACRLLDRHGLLRQANKESRKRATKDWEAVDFYDSDEDSFLDRTGDIEKKRQHRMIQSGKMDTTVETHESLTKKYKECVGKLDEAKSRLLALTVEQKPQNYSNDDEVAEYVSTLWKSDAEKKKIEGVIETLTAEKESLEKLVSVTEPANVPSMSFSPMQELKLEDSSDDENLDEKQENNEITKQKNNKIINTIIDDDKVVKKPKKTEIEKLQLDKSIKLKFDLPVVPEEEEGLNVEQNRHRTRSRQKLKKKKSEKAADPEEYGSTWTPPPGQTGDGRTSLNDKFGY